jgi:hypothetical protein
MTVKEMESRGGRLLRLFAFIRDWLYRLTTKCVFFQCI